MAEFLHFHLLCTLGYSREYSPDRCLATQEIDQVAHIQKFVQASVLLRVLSEHFL